MSKLGIVLFAVLLASGVNCSILPVGLEISPHKAQQVVDTAISEVRTRNAAIQEWVLKLNEKLSNKTTEFNDFFWRQVILVVKKAVNKIEDMSPKATGVNITECRHLSDDLDDITNAVWSNAEQCSMHELEKQLTKIKSINKDFDDALLNLAQIREKVQNCSNDFNDPEFIVGAIVCAAAARKKATRVSEENFRITWTWINNVKISLKTLLQTFSDCATNNGFKMLQKEWLAVVESTRKCIQQKVDEAAATNFTPETALPTKEFPYLGRGYLPPPRRVSPQATGL